VGTEGTRTVSPKCSPTLVVLRLRHSSTSMPKRQSSNRRSRRTPACRRARGRQGQALRAAAGSGRPWPRLRAAAASVRGSGRKNGSAGGRTKECHETGGQHDVKPESLIPSSHLSTKPG